MPLASGVIRSGLSSTMSRHIVRGASRARGPGIRRCASTQPEHRTITARAFRFGRAGKLALLTGGAFAAYGILHADSEDPAKYSQPSLSSLIRTYVVYTICSFPSLVDASPTILKTLMGVPGVKQITEGVVRLTFFDQFVGGDTAAETVPLLRILRAQNKGALFAYSVEVDEDEASGSGSGSTNPHKRIIEEMIRCIDVAAEFEDNNTRNGVGAGAGGQGRSEGGARKTWVALKLTALLPDAHALINLSKHILASRLGPAIPFPGNPESSDLDILSEEGAISKYLSKEEIASLKELKGDLERVCSRAKERGVKIIVDAEYSWYQPAIDAYTLSLSEKFNRIVPEEIIQPVQPLIYGTYQAYLRRTPEHLERALQHAKANSYSLGVKLVRGAYHPHELSAHGHPSSDSAQTGEPSSQEKHSSHYGSLSISPDSHPPVWLTKDDTDRCYNECVKMLIKAVRDDIVASSASPLSARKTIVPSPPSTSSSAWWPTSWWARPKEDTPTPALALAVTSSSSSDSIPRVGLLFGTHNWNSCRTILDELVKNGLAKEAVESEEPRSESKVVSIPDSVVERVAIGQLYGMSDDLTDWLVNSTMSNSPLIIKYVPYGALSEVMPYLSRRAIENKSVLGGGGAEREKQRAVREIKKRLFRSRASS
ncbi:hypothetical protein AX16_009372 [Volvariella volvacea WC 439]|nr:hypothetical protein AX16_009372 [Volvariella volvacea WC 439]